MINKNKTKKKLRSCNTREAIESGTTLIAASSADAVGCLTNTFASQAVAVRSGHAANWITVALETIDTIQIEKKVTKRTRFASQSYTIRIAFALTSLYVTNIISVHDCRRIGADRVTRAFLTSRVRNG